jgi:hypothetical protein
MLNRNEYVIILDTETTNSMDDPLCYDVGFAVVNPFTGEVAEAHSFVVAEIFLDEELMATAYFADKIPLYEQALRNGEKKLARFNTIRRVLAETCKTYGVNKIFAHNMRFDYRSCNTTQRWLTSSKYRYFFPYGVEVWDTLKMARAILKTDENYGEFCYENDYLTKNGQRRYTAEIIFRFLVDDVTFEEEHMGIEDVMIEKEILRHCVQINPEIDGKLW